MLSAELFLQPATSAEWLDVQLALLGEHVDGILLTDNQGGRLHLSPVAAASLVLARGVDPIVQFGTRNRNRIALLAELLGAAAIGVTSVVLVRGNRVPEGFRPRPKAVHDVDPGALIAMAARLKDDEHLAHMPDLYVGSEFTLHQPAEDWEPVKLKAKSAHGAQFAISNLCLNADVVGQYMTAVVAAGLPRELDLHVSIPVPGSPDDARWLRDTRPNKLLVPDAVIARLEQAPDPEREGIRIAAELLQAVRAIPGVRGAHLVATRNLALIPAAIEAGGCR